MFRTSLTTGDVFGEVCLFEYLCKYRHETAKALSYIQVFLMTDVRSMPI
jgi:hypothetical protein